MICRAHEDYLRQGDVVVDVPLSVAPPRIAWLQQEGAGANARLRIVSEERRGGYSMGQTFVSDAAILTYDCDIDRILERILNGIPRAPEDVCTVVAALPVTPEQANLRDIQRGAMPRYTFLPETTFSAPRILDFTTLQNVDLRLILKSLKCNGRLLGVSDPGQYRLIESLAHELGDVFRRGRAGGVNDPTLFARALALI